MPRFMWRSAAEALGGWASAALRFDEEAQFRYETMLCYFAGYFSARREEASSGLLPSQPDSSVR